MHDESNDQLALERILFFSDAVFAIAITLLVIEIKVPTLPHGAGDAALATGLLRLMPRFVGFFVSFFLIGQTWFEHHRMGRQLVRFDRGLIWRNLWLLFFVAFMPFASALLSEFFTTRVAVVAYAAAFTGLGLAKVAFWRHAVRNGLVTRGQESESIGRRVWATPIATGISMIGGAIVGPWAAAGFGLIPIFASVLDRKGRPAA